MTLEALEEYLDRPALRVELEDFVEAQLRSLACGQIDLPVLEVEQLAAWGPAFSLRFFPDPATTLLGDGLGHAKRDKAHRETFFASGEHVAVYPAFASQKSEQIYCIHVLRIHK